MHSPTVCLLKCIAYTTTVLAEEPMSSSGASSVLEQTQLSVVRRKRGRPSKRLCTRGTFVQMCDELLERIIAFVPSACVLQQLACTSRACNVYVNRLSHAHVARLQECVLYTRCAPPPTISIPRALRILCTRKCELCGEGRVVGFKTPWAVFAHDKCINSKIMNAYYIGAALCIKLCLARAPYKLQQVWCSRGSEPIMTALFWLHAHPAVPQSWTVQGVSQMTAEECFEAGQTCPAQLTENQQQQLYQIMENMTFSQLRARAYN